MKRKRKRIFFFELWNTILKNIITFKTFFQPKNGSNDKHKSQKKFVQYIRNLQEGINSEM